MIFKQDVEYFWQKISRVSKFEENAGDGVKLKIFSSKNSMLKN